VAINNIIYFNVMQLLIIEYSLKINILISFWKEIYVKIEIYVMDILKEIELSVLRYSFVTNKDK
jgi:hypothetical protein